MIRLDKNKVQSGLGNHPREVETTKQKFSSSELEKFSLYVLKVLIDKNIPPTPNNFPIYFDKLLENKPLSFQKRINEILETENTNEDEHHVKMEMEVKEGFKQVESIMKVVSTVYKNLNVMKTIANKRASELEVSSGQLSATNIISSLGKDLNKLSNLINKQMGLLKTHYEKTGAILQEIESESVFDSRFGVYNRRYFLRAIEHENKLIEQFNHNSTLVLVKIKDNVLNKIVNQKDKMILTRNIAKLLLKTSRRSDIVAHYGEGIFGVLMKHTDVSNTQRACDRISELIYATSFFIGDTEVDTDIELAIVPLTIGSTTELIVSLGLDALPKTGKKLDTYIVCDVEERKEEEEKVKDGA